MLKKIIPMLGIVFSVVSVNAQNSCQQDLDACVIACTEVIEACDVALKKKQYETDLQKQALMDVRKDYNNLYQRYTDDQKNVLRKPEITIPMSILLGILIGGKVF